MNKILAVYGTLRKGESNHKVLGDSEFVKEVRIIGFKMYGKATFPAVIKGEEEDSIVIEIYRITNPEILETIDMLEGFDRKNPSSPDNLYTIQSISIDSINESIEIYTFDHLPEMVHSLGAQLKHGDWKKR